MRNICLAFTAFITTATAASSADQTHEVKFHAGSSSATLSGDVKGYDTMNYLLGANGGQAMSILFSPKNANCYFNVFAPGADEAMFIGSEQGSNEFSTNLRESGKYKVQVYLMRNAARRNEECKFSVTFEISGRRI